MKTLLYTTLQILSPPEKRCLAWQMLFNLLISVADIFFLGTLVLLINYYVHPADSKLPVAITNVIHQNTLAFIIVFTAIFCIKNIAGYRVFRHQYQLVYRVARRISTYCLKQYLGLPYQQYVAADKSAWQRRISQQPVEFGHYILNGIQVFVTEVAIATLVIGGILLLNTRLFLVLLLIMAPPVILLSVFTRQKLKEARSNIKTTSERSLLYLHEALYGFTESKVYSKEQFFVNRYSNQQSSLNDHLSQLQTIQGLPTRVTELFVVAGLLIIALLGKYYTGYTGNYLIEVGAFAAAAYKLLPGIVRIYNITGQMKSYGFTVDGLPPYQDTTTLTQPQPPAIHSITCSDLRFAYGEKLFFYGQQLNFTAGSFTAITGTSGKGKTSLFHLLTGFNKPGGGTICVNGMPVSDSQLQQLLPAIAYVPQQSFFIRDSVRNNILMGEQPDEHRLQEVIRATGLDVLSAETTSCLDVMIYEDGKNISGGQRQRLAIARALYKAHTSLILLDEPFNELDQLAEEHLMQYFRQLANTGKIVILITHNATQLHWCTHHVTL